MEHLCVFAREKSCAQRLLETYFLFYIYQSGTEFQMTVIAVRTTAFNITLPTQYIYMLLTILIRGPGERNLWKDISFLSAPLVLIAINLHMRK